MRDLLRKANEYTRRDVLSSIAKTALGVSVYHSPTN